MRNIHSYPVHSSHEANTAVDINNLIRPIYLSPIWWQVKTCYLLSTNTSTRIYFLTHPICTVHDSWQGPFRVCWGPLEKRYMGPLFVFREGEAPPIPPKRDFDCSTIALFDHWIYGIVTAVGWIQVASHYQGTRFQPGGPCNCLVCLAGCDRPDSRSPRGRLETGPDSLYLSRSD